MKRFDAFRIFDAYRVYLFFEGASALCFSIIVTVNLVYQVEMVKLNPLQLVLVGTLLETVCFFSEIPTGIVADLYSRRLSIIIGFLLFGLGFILEGSIPRFEVVLMAQVVWGLGATFLSGATQAWISDEIGESRANRAFLRASQVSNISALAGTAISVVLASLQVNIPVIVGGALLVTLGVFLILVMPENGFKPTPAEDRNTWQHMTGTLRSGMEMVRLRPALLSILVIGTVYGMHSEGFDRLWTAHILQDLTLPRPWGIEPVAWFGIIAAISMILNTAAMQLVWKKGNIESHGGAAQLLFTCYALLTLAVVAFGLAGNFVTALMTYWTARLFRGLGDPIYTAWVNQRLDPRVRATVISMSSQFNAFGQIAGGPAVGTIGTVVSLRAALVVAGLVLAPALPLITRAARRFAS
ncbi:MAG: MFS transporter [Chloroflexi bacterium]|nr:MFS transporter [Chloroflexota bacterium]